MDNLYEYWKDKVGTEVIFTGEIKCLIKGTVGILTSVYPTWCTIVYPQNSAYEDLPNGGWKPKKNFPNLVYAHSAKLDQIKENEI